MPSYAAQIPCARSLGDRRLCAGTATQPALSGRQSHPRKRASRLIVRTKNPPSRRRIERRTSGTNYYWPILGAIPRDACYQRDTERYCPARRPARCGYRCASRWSAQPGWHRASVGYAAVLSRYLAAYLWCLNLALGSMALLLIYQLTGGAWGFFIRRSLEAGMSTLPLLAIGFIPIALGAPQLYLWCQPKVVASNELLESQQIYMNFPSVVPTSGDLFWAVAGD